MRGEKGNHIEKVANGRILNLGLIKHSTYLLIGTDEDILFYKVNKGFQVQKLAGGHVGPVIGLFYLDFKRLHGNKLKNSPRIVSIGDDNTIRVWDAVDQSEIACFPAPGDTELLCLHYLDKFGLLATGHENGDIYLWDIEVGNKIKLKNKVKAVDTICCMTHLFHGESDYLFSAG